MPIIHVNADDAEACVIAMRIAVAYRSRFGKDFLVDLVRRQKRIVGAYYGSASPHETFRTIVELYLRGDLLGDELIARRYALDQINEGFAALERGENVKISSFGTFVLRDKTQRMGRNPKTGQSVSLDGKYVPHFKPGKELRDRVNED